MDTPILILGYFKINYTNPLGVNCIMSCLFYKMYVHITTLQSICQGAERTHYLCPSLYVWLILPLLALSGNDSQVSTVFF